MMELSSSSNSESERKPSGRAPPRKYRFVCNLVQDVVYKILPTDQRRILHRRVAIEIQREIKAAHASERRKAHVSLAHSGRLTQLAYHYSRSNETKPALQYLCLAAQAALEQNAPEYAARSSEAPACT